jgi:anthranilate synthase component II
MLDNYDSFTFNLVHYLQQLDVEVVVKRNDELSLSQVKSIAPTHLVISPGPCDPDKAGICLDLIDHFKAKLPILGVCLGHQVIGQVFGAKVIKAKQVMHGKTSKIFHQNQGVFEHLPQGFKATRYHSLILEKPLPSCLSVTAWTEDPSGQIDVIMALQHNQYPIQGVQFHPESIMSEHGLTMLKQFVDPD